MGKIGRGSGVRQIELGCSHYLCDLYNIPCTGTTDQCTTVEMSLLQEATYTHPIPVNSCEC